MQALNLPFYARNPAMLAITLPGVHERRQNTAGSSYILGEWRSWTLE